jgi:hypothetical protein
LLHIIGKVLDRPRQNLLAGRPFDIKLEVGDVLIADLDSERLHQRAFRIELSDKRRLHVERHGEILASGRNARRWH